MVQNKLDTFLQVTFLTSGKIKQIYLNIFMKCDTLGGYGESVIKIVEIQKWESFSDKLSLIIFYTHKVYRQPAAIIT